MITCQIKKILGGNPKYEFNFFFIDNDDWFLYSSSSGLKISVYRGLEYNRIRVDK